MKARILEFKKGSSETEGKDVIAVTDAMPPGEVIRLAHAGTLRHIVQKDNLAFDSEIGLSKVMIERPEVFLDHPTETILGLGEAASHLPNLEVKFSTSERKHTAMMQFSSFIQALPGSRSIRDQAIVIADELYTNGAKNAWQNRLTPGEGPVRPGTVEFFARSDDQRLIIGCRDSFGELGLARVLSRIQTCYQNGVAQSINQGSGGAGIGSFLVFNSCISYYAGVELGKRTVVCVALPLGISLRETAGLTKNIHLLSVA